MADESGAVPLGLPQGAAGIPVTVNAGITTGPDGKPWAVLGIVQGSCSFSFMVTEAQAPELAKILATTLQRIEVELRRARLGIVVPGPHNGHPQP